MVLTLQKSHVADEMDDDLDDDDAADVKDATPVHDELDDEIIESDIELEGETVEPDNDPPQKVILRWILQSMLMIRN